MRKYFIVCLISIFGLLLGCQHDNVTSAITWGSKHDISINDISEIEIRKDEASYSITNQQDILRFIDVVKHGEYDNGQLDILPADYVVGIKLTSGEIKKFSFWLVDGGNIFTDHDDNGHYKLRHEDDRSTLVELINKADKND